jgi:hypothetical protein
MPDNMNDMAEDRYEFGCSTSVSDRSSRSGSCSPSGPASIAPGPVPVLLLRVRQLWSLPPSCCGICLRLFLARSFGFHGVYQTVRDGCYWIPRGVIRQKNLLPY